MALKVLLVEDTVGLPMSKVLNKWGYEVALATDGEDAWAQASTTPFDCYLIDWMLPGMSGIELVQKLRQFEGAHDKPIVMISGRSEKADIATANQSGIDSYLAKPFTAVQLRDKIEEVVAAHMQKAKGKQAVQSIERITKMHMQFNRNDGAPFLLFGEPACTANELKNPIYERIVEYLNTATEAVDQINAERENLKLGLTISTDADEVIQYIRSQVTRRRISAVLLSVDFKGNALRLTRLLCTNKSEDDFPVFLVCNKQSDIPFVEHANLEELGVNICERSDFNVDYWQRIFADYISKEEEEENESKDGETT